MMRPDHWLAHPVNRRRARVTGGAGSLIVAVSTGVIVGVCQHPTWVEAPRRLVDVALEHPSPAVGPNPEPSRVDTAALQAATPPPAAQVSPTDSHAPAPTITGSGPVLRPVACPAEVAVSDATCYQPQSPPSQHVPAVSSPPLSTTPTAAPIRVADPGGFRPYRSGPGSVTTPSQTSATGAVSDGVSPLTLGDAHHRQDHPAPARPSRGRDTENTPTTPAPSAGHPPQTTSQTESSANPAARLDRVRGALPPGFVPLAPAPAAPRSDTSAATVPGRSPASAAPTSDADALPSAQVTAGSDPAPGTTLSVTNQPGTLGTPTAPPAPMSPVGTASVVVPVACPVGVTVAGASCYQAQPPTTPSSLTAPPVSSPASPTGTTAFPLGQSGAPAAGSSDSVTTSAPINVNGQQCQVSDQAPYRSTGHPFSDLMGWAMGQAQACMTQHAGGVSTSGRSAESARRGSSSGRSLSASSKKSHHKADDQ